MLRERARSDKHTARVLLPDPVTGEETTQLLYAWDVGLIVAGPGLTTRPDAIETLIQRKRRKDCMKGRLEPSSASACSRCSAKVRGRRQRQSSTLR